MKIHTIARAAQEMWNAWTEVVQTDIDATQRLTQLQNDVVAIVREEGIEPALPPEQPAATNARVPSCCAPVRLSHVTLEVQENSCTSQCSRLQKV